MRGGLVNMSALRQAPPHAGDYAATGFLVLLPLAMWAQSRASLLFLVAAAACAGLARWKTGDLKPVWLRMRMLATGPVGVPLLLFLAWAALSVLWSHRPRAGLQDWAELALPMAAGLLLATAWPAHAPRWALRAIATSVLIATLFTLGELILGPGLRFMLGIRPHSFIFNRTTICLLLMIIPVCVVFLVPVSRWIEKPWEQRVMRQGMVIAFALFALCLLKTESGAVRLGALAAVAVGLMSWLLPRLTVPAFAAGLVAMVALGPVQGLIGERLLPPSLHETMSESHSRDRVDIWLAFGELIGKRPLVGAGLGSAAAASGHPLARDIAGRNKVLLDVGHPHSLQVQAWAETGLIGAMLLLSAGLMALLRLRTWPAGLRTLALGTAAGALAIAAVGHGAWQGWWIAALAVSCALFTLAKRVVDGDIAPRQDDPAASQEASP
jgi:O-antigen ligase